MAISETYPSQLTKGPDPDFTYLYISGVSGTNSHKWEHWGVRCQFGDPISSVLAALTMRSTTVTSMGLFCST